MPKIDAPTVAEHHARRKTAVVAAAERIMRAQGIDALTAAAVTSEAGIARNSLYRYVDSVDDLKTLVIAQYLPPWKAAVMAAVEPLEAPADRIRVWVRTNLQQAAATGHGWLMTLAQSRRGAADPAVTAAHHEMVAIVVDAWRAVCPAHATSLAHLTNAMVSNGFAQLDAGAPLAEVEAVVGDSVDAMLERFAASESAPAAAARHEPVSWQSTRDAAAARGS